MIPATRNNTASAPAAWSPVNRLDSIFDRVFGEDAGLMSRAWSGAPMAMWEDDDHLWIEAELPGVSYEDLDVTVHDGTLTIRGEIKPAEGRRYLYNGRSFGRFERAVALPKAVDPEQVQARLKDGILLLDLPKSPAARPRKVEVRQD